MDRAVRRAYAAVRFYRASSTWSTSSRPNTMSQDSHRTVTGHGNKWHGGRMRLKIAMDERSGCANLENDLDRFPRNMISVSAVNSDALIKEWPPRFHNTQGMDCL